ncbi:MAG: hypothetical protein VZQ84_01960 [Anaerovoracaceae bacterium]|nr:hypothetical protein [Anaerovoracaceae bacterium]
MAFNETEQKILDNITEGRGSADHIARLLKNGADVNAVESEPDGIESVGGEPYYSTLLGEALYENNENGFFRHSDLVRTFLDCGWDAKKYGSSVMNDLAYQVTNRRSTDFYALYKMILDAAGPGMELAQALNGLSTEQEYYEMSTPVNEGGGNDELENYLFGLGHMLRKYSAGEDYSVVYQYDLALGQKVKSVRVAGGPARLDSGDEFSISAGGRDAGFIMEIELEDDTLVIDNSYFVYIDNGSMQGSRGTFAESAAEFLKGMSFEVLRFTVSPFGRTPASLNAARFRSVELVFDELKCLTFYNNEAEQEAGVRTRILPGHP